VTTTGKILITAPYFMPVVERYRARLEGQGFALVIREVNERAEEHELLEVIGDVDGVICGDDRFTARVIAEAARLKVISKWGTGIDSIDQEACARRGIVVCRTPNAFTVPVSDSVLAYALAFVRNVATMDRAMKAGTWEKIPGRSLSECTVGVVGVGNIGSRVARLFHAFEATVLGNDIREISPEIVSAARLRMVALDELLAESDIVTLCCDLNPTSEHLIDAAALRQMKPTALLVNAARGPIVDEGALCAALADGSIAGAAMDVFEREPLPADSPLRNMDHVLLAPHNSNSSPTAWERVHESTVQNLLSVLASHD
jgi:D-3-phosphoglycerate dehydrogenase